MTVTFLVAITLEDTTDLFGIALDIQDDLSSNFVVESVKPWARPSDPLNQPAGGFASLTSSLVAPPPPPPPL